MNTHTALALCAAAVGAASLLFANEPASKPAEKETTASGLTIIHVEKSDGACKAGDHVWVHYTGTLTDGTKFDSSVDRGKPLDFDLGQGRVIKGWDEGIAGMKVGDKRQLIIPSELGYGATGTPGGPIPPNATLNFDVELVGKLRR